MNYKNFDIKPGYVFKSKDRGILVEIVCRSKQVGTGGIHWNVKQKNGKCHHISSIVLSKRFERIM